MDEKQIKQIIIFELESVINEIKEIQKKYIYKEIEYTEPIYSFDECGSTGTVYIGFNFQQYIKFDKSIIQGCSIGLNLTNGASLYDLSRGEPVNAKYLDKTAVIQQRNDLVLILTEIISHIEKKIQENNISLLKRKMNKDSW